MKKTKLMRAALLLLVLTLITSCFVGGTFAKYTTSKTGSDTARVAKWGVAIDAKGTTFAKEYKTDTENVVGTIANSVVSKNEVVAPGTKGEMAKIAITGTPEVAVSVNYAADFKVVGWTVGDKFYCPLHIKVGDTLIDGTGFTDVHAFENAVSDAISKLSGKYDAGTNLNGARVPSVSWEWPFEVSTDTGAENPQTNEKDTALGDLTVAPTVKLTVITTVEQID